MRSSYASIRSAETAVSWDKIWAWRKFSGYFAFVLWAGLHIFFLIGFRRKLTTFIEWIWSYFFGTRGVRLITGDKRLPRPIKPPPDQRNVWSDR